MHRLLNSARLAAVLCLFVFVSACGGGGGGGGGSTSQPAAQVQAPAISTQPGSAAISDGGSLTFSVAATGTPPLLYQWQKNGQDIPGATQATFELNPATLGDDQAEFSVIVRNSAGSATSSPARLTVNWLAPLVVLDPQQQAALAGESAMFVVIANGSGPLTFQWRKDGVDIVGANQSSYTVAATLGNSGAVYDVVITNAAGSIISNGGVLTVYTVATAPSIENQPQDVTVQVGGTATFTVTANGTGPFSYEWLRNDAVISGATGASYRVTPAAQSNSGDTYQVRVTNSLGTVASSVARLTVPAPLGLSLLAGRFGGAGNVDGIGTAARLNAPQGVAVDAAGNIFIVDANNFTIRKVTPAGIVTTFAGQAGLSGTADGTGSAARFTAPGNMTIDPAGNLYVVDARSAIRKITPTGVVSTFAGLVGQYGYVNDVGTLARFRQCDGIASDAAGNLYVSDYANYTVRKITPGALVSTLAGDPDNTFSADGTGSAAGFWGAAAIAVDAAGDLYVADVHTIRKVTAAGVVTTLAGNNNAYGEIVDGVGSAARFETIEALTLGADGNLFITDTSPGDGGFVRRVTPAGEVTYVAGSWGQGYADGIGHAASFRKTRGIAADSSGVLYVADTANDALRKVTLAGAVSTMVGKPQQAGGSIDGIGEEAAFLLPAGIATDTAGNVYVADASFMNSRIRRIAPNGQVATLTGFSPGPFFSPSALVLGDNGDIYLTDNTVVSTINAAGISVVAGAYPMADYVDGQGSVARFWGPNGIVRKPSGDLYVVDTENHAVRKVTAAGFVSTFAGSGRQAGASDGNGTAARFRSPRGIALDAAGNFYVADAGNHVIRKITAVGVVSTLAGSAGLEGDSDGVGGSARFRSPTGVAVDAAGNVYVADAGNRLVRKITAAGAVTTIAGTRGSVGLRFGALPGSFGSATAIAFMPTTDGRTVLIVSDTAESSVVQIVLP